MLLFDQNFVAGEVKLYHACGVTLVKSAHPALIAPLFVFEIMPSNQARLQTVGADHRAA